MRTAKRSVRRRNRALVVFVLSICLLLNGSLLVASAQQSLSDDRRADQSPNQSPNQSDDAASQRVSRPRRIDPDRQYDDDGPLIRVALVTDVTDVTIISSSSAGSMIALKRWL